MVIAMRTEERPDIDARLILPNDPRPRMLRAAMLLSGMIAALMVAASVTGLFVRDLYHETAWGREALRGGDLVTLVLAAPILIAALVLVQRGSIRAQAVWIGVLFYSLYGYAYYAFGATFNDAFLAHIAIFSMSVFALACALPALEYGAIAREFRAVVGAAKVVGIFLVIVGLAQGALWLYVLANNIATGELLHDIPVSGQHLVFALDLALLAPMLVLSGALLARRRPAGYLLGTAMAVMGAAYQVNMMVAGVFQDRADVVGVRAFAPESVFLTSTFVIAALVMLLAGRRRPQI
jgi:hypothetical protein